MTTADRHTIAAACWPRDAQQDNSDSKSRGETTTPYGLIAASASYLRRLDAERIAIVARDIAVVLHMRHLDGQPADIDSIAAVGLWDRKTIAEALPLAEEIAREHARNFGVI